MTRLSAEIEGAHFGAHVTGIVFLGQDAVFALGDGTLRFVGPTGERSVAAHEGACFSIAVAPCGGVITGGDDGRLVRSDASGADQVLAETGGRWIDHVATSQDGSVAWASGKRISVQGHVTRELTAPSSAGGLAFHPKGSSLAIAHYNGVSLWNYHSLEEPELLEWKGTHTSLAFSPDGRFLATAMLENALHAWRLADGRHMRMAGYPGKVRGLSWSASGAWLASTGADTLIVWPFADDNGPRRKTPKQLVSRSCRTTAVACHPEADIAAAGFADGSLAVVQIENEVEVTTVDAGGGAVTCVVWDSTGRRAAFGTEEGRTAILTF